MSATLASLRIRNLALVEELLWEPGPGFTALTGETGAGKSVIIGALNLLLGERADKSVIRTGEAACSVEAEFAGAEGVHHILDAAGAEPCEDGRLIVKRVIQSGGTGRQFVNGSPCTLALLRSLGGALVDLHGPHDHQSLFSRDQQTLLLDAYAGAGSERTAFESARSAHAALVRERDECARGESEALREIDLLTHQTAEIEAARLVPGEEADLLARHRAAANAARIGELCAGLGERLSGDGPALAGSVAEVVRACRELARLDPRASAVEAAAEALGNLIGELENEISRFADLAETDPAALAALEERIDTIMTLKRKYGPSFEDVIAYGKSAAARLEALRARAGRAGSLETEVAAAAARCEEAARALSARRRKAARALESAVVANLRDLGFLQAAFAITLERLDPPGPLGAELAEFVFAPNPGEESRPLRSVASSGEISRVMLALKGALAAQDEVPLLVFDEIDANVGGEVAVRVAGRMRELARGRQVLCITHLPQVAAAADHHFVVAKDVSGGRTRTRLTPCAGDDRVAELARMLGGKSQSAIAHAKALLKRDG